MAEYETLIKRTDVILKETFFIPKCNMTGVCVDDYKDYVSNKDGEFYIYKKNLFVKSVKIITENEKTIITLHRVKEITLNDEIKTEITYAFRDAYYLFLNQKNVLCFHSCGISINGFGILISGRPGSGKTTLSKVFKNKDTYLVGDDINACICKRDRILMCGMPWCRKNNNIKCEVKAIIFLSNSSNISRHIMTIEEIEKELRNSEFALQWSNEGINCISNIIDSIYNNTRCIAFNNNKTTQDKLNFKNEVSNLIDVLREASQI